MTWLINLKLRTGDWGDPYSAHKTVIDHEIRFQHRLSVWVENVIDNFKCKQFIGLLPIMRWNIALVGYILLGNFVLFLGREEANKYQQFNNLVHFPDMIWWIGIVFVIRSSFSFDQVGCYVFASRIAFVLGRQVSRNAFDSNSLFPHNWFCI
jgi:hypothetical protein